MTNIDKFVSSFGKIEVPIHGVRLPEFIVEGKTDGSKKQNLDFLTELCRKGYKKLSIEKGKEKEYADRVKYELETLSELGFVDYILLTWNFINHCVEENIPIGDGRGSAAGSFVLYLIGVTGLDPIEHGLIFERFISKTRAKMKTVDGITYLDGSLMCDIDCDVDYYRRGELIEFLEKEYGAIKILNLNKMAGKQLIKDCGKIVAARKESEMNEISSLIPTEYGKNMDLEEVYNTIEPFKEWVESNVENRQAYMIALKLRGLIRNKGVHASGMAIAYGNIEEQCPIELTKDKDGKKHKVSSYDMSQVSLMFVKLDVLGLKTLSVVDEACSMIGIKATDIDVHDPSIYDFMQDFKYPHGVFQLESWATSNACKKIKPKNIDETSAVLAIARPGAIDYIDKFSRYTNYSEYESLHPFFDDILKETGGVCLYQEQALRMSNKIGFSLEESEILRRCIGKKKKKEMEEWEQRVKDKIKENGLDPEIGNVLWKILDDSSNYSFNKSHSISYAFLTVKTIWLKQNHPKEFYMALLKMAKRESDTLEQISIIEKELGHFGIKLLPPNLIKSGMDFSSEGDDIRYGLTDIKGIKEKSIEKLSYFKDEYSNKFQVFQAATEAKLGLAVMCPLIQAGALTGYSQSRSRMVLEFQLWNNLKAREKLFCIDMADEFDNDLIELIKNIKGKEDESGKPYMKESRLETLRKAYKPYQSIYSQNSKNEDIANWYYENKLLGYNPENRLISIYGDKIPSLKPLEEIQKDKPDTHHTFIGIVVKKADKKSKNGNRYINYIIEDEKAQVEVKLFDGRGQIDQCMKDNGDQLPDENDIVVVDALRKDEKVFFGSQIIVQNVKVYMRLGELKESVDKIE